MQNKNKQMLNNKNRYKWKRMSGGGACVCVDLLAEGIWCKQNSTGGVLFLLLVVLSEIQRVPVCASSEISPVKRDERMDPPLLMIAIAAEQSLNDDETNRKSRSSIHALEWLRFLYKREKLFVLGTTESKELEKERCVDQSDGDFSTVLLQLKSFVIKYLEINGALLNFLVTAILIILWVKIS